MCLECVDCMSVELSGDAGERFKLLLQEVRQGGKLLRGVGRGREFGFVALCFLTCTSLRALLLWFPALGSVFVVRVREGLQSMSTMAEGAVVKFVCISLQRSMSGL